MKEIAVKMHLSACKYPAGWFNAVHIVRSAQERGLQKQQSLS